MTNKKISSSIVSGVLWLLFHAVGSRAIAFISQIILAWILVPADFGKVSIVYAITNISFLTHQLGLTDVLIKRRKIYLWINHAYTISIVVSFVSILLTIILGIVIGHVYHDVQITWMVFILCLTLPLYSLTTIADAKLRIDGRFKVLSITKTIESLLNVIGTIWLAYLDFNAYSFVIPPVFSVFFKFIVLNHYSSLHFKFKFVFKRLKYLLVDSIWGLLHMLFQRIINQMDYLIIGYLYDQVIVGIYYMAFSLSVQSISLIASNIPPVLFPSLNLIENNISSQKGYIIKISSAIAFFAIPFAFWQFTITAPFIKIFFSEKWLPTIPIIEILSIGMAFRSGTWLWSVPFRLTGEFSKLSKISFISLIFLACLLLPLTHYFNVYGAAIAVSFFYAIASPVWFVLGIKLLNGKWFDVVRIIGYPLLFSVISFGSCMFLKGEYMSNTSPFIIIISATVYGFGIYFLLFYIFKLEEIKGYQLNIRKLLHK